ncbi:outer membrane lipoprotein chaperone LolA [Ferrimonas gelatinilytica]|uniref:Outer-membrane lipoprotein carrier protein n=1 Tax=Ferrimonas gelatinilytica TaxID=1255257 RepID=A0ABP9RX07_9GAMM
MNKVIPTLLIASLFPVTAVCDDDAQSLQQRLSQLPHFSAEFHQQARDFDDNLVQESQGRLALSAPLRFRWEQDTPESLLLVSDGDAVWFHDPYVEQVTVTSVDQAVAQTPLTLLASQDPKIWSQWQIQQQASCYRLTSDAHPAVSMTVCFEGDAIRSLQLDDAQGTSTVMELQNFSTEAVDSAQFTFAPPEGTLIDDQRGS